MGSQYTGTSSQQRDPRWGNRKYVFLLTATASYEYTIDICSVARHREAQSLPALEVFVIDVISATSANLDHQDAAWLKTAKLSSTFIRQWIVENEVEQ